MTPKEAERTLEQGCTHMPWSEDVCGNCAKGILEVLINTREGTKKICRVCGDPTHSTPEHTSWVGFNDQEE